MKKMIIIFILAHVLVSCVQGEADEKKIVIDDKSKLIDVRTEKEFREGHLNNAINIPYDEIKVKIKGHAKGKEEKIILYCRSGRRSAIAKKALEDIGYKNVLNAGAYEDLKKKEKNE